MVEVKKWKSGRGGRVNNFGTFEGMVVEHFGISDGKGDLKCPCPPHGRVWIFSGITH